MGHNTMKLANGPLYRNVQGLDFRVLMYLAQVTLDHDNARDGIPERTYFKGIDAIVEHIYDLQPGDPGYSNAYRRIQRSIANLVAANAIRRTQPAIRNRHARYEVCPLQSRLS